MSSNGAVLPDVRRSTATWPKRALADAEATVFWLDDPARPDALPALEGEESADLVVVGGGYTGLWAALRAKERDPSTDVVLVEAGHCGDQASERNGGFASASLTPGFANGTARWPTEMRTLERLGAENLQGIADTITRHGIDCCWEPTGELSVARADHEAEETTRSTTTGAASTDTSTRFTAFFGTALGGRVAYALGYTALGVAATRFCADVALDLLSGEPSERTSLELVRRRPTPFPPEPLRYAGVQLTRWSLGRADGHGGHRNLWLRTRDRAGLGFDS